MNPIEYQHPTEQKAFAFGSDTLSEHSPGRRPDVEDGETGSMMERGVGALLKDARQRKGFDLGQISEMTRIQPHILQALESEDWPRLPSPIFVKGFVRSYAHAVGLDEGEIVALYQKNAPSGLTTPKPLGEPVGSRKIFSVMLILLLLAMALAYFFGKGYLPGKGVLERSQTMHSVGSSMVNSEPVQETFSETQELPLKKQKESVWGQVSESVEQVPQTEKALIRAASAPEPSPELVDVKPPNNPIEEKAATSFSAGPLLAYEPEISPETESRELILKANVREKTWVRIFVDDQDPKEYIFTPGSYPEWKAKEGMELLIGNAGGISFEFNGVQIENIGNPGQVVRLSLPEGYKRKKFQD
jgi:cytoskeleton protein RodZ